MQRGVFAVLVGVLVGGLDARAEEPPDNIAEERELPEVQPAQLRAEMALLAPNGPANAACHEFVGATVQAGIAACRRRVDAGTMTRVAFQVCFSNNQQFFLDGLATCTALFPISRASPPRVQASLPPAAWRVPWRPWARDRLPGAP